MSNITQSVAPVTTVATTSSKKSHKAQLTAMVTELCVKHGLETAWIGKGHGVNGLAKLDDYFSRVTVEDKAAFMATNASSDVTEKLLPALVEVEQAEKVETKVEETPVVAEAKAEIVLTCTCGSCANSNKPRKGPLGAFLAPIPWLAKQKLDLHVSCTLMTEDLSKVAVHRSCAWQAFEKPEHACNMVREYQKAEEFEARTKANELLYQEEKAEAEANMGRSIVYATGNGYWCKVGRGDNAQVVLVSEAVVPPSKYVLFNARGEPMSPALLCKFAVPASQARSVYYYRRLVLTPLAEALAFVSPTLFGHLVK